MASFPTVDFSQYQWVVNDTNYLTKWNNFQTAINTLQANINKFGVEVKAEVDSAIGIAQSLIEAYNVNVLEPFKAKCTLGLDFALGLYFVDDGTERVETTDPESILTFTRSTIKNIEGPNGRLREAAINTIAREWHLGEQLGALVEERRDNKLLWSEDFSNVVWSKESVVVEPTTALNPKGNPGADLIKPTTANSIHRILQVTPLYDTERQAISIFAKSGGYSLLRIRNYSDTYGTALATFDLSNGNVVTNTDLFGLSAKARLMSGGWVRISMSADYLKNAIFELLGGTLESPIEVFSGDGNSGIYLWGAQVEDYSVSSYISTEASPATRSADSAIIPLGGEFNKDRFSIFLEVFDFNPNAPSDPFDAGVLSINAGGAAIGAIELRNNSILFRDAGNANNSINAGEPYLGGRAKIVYSYNGSQAVLSVNGKSWVNNSVSSSVYDNADNITPFYRRGWQDAVNNTKQMMMGPPLTSSQAEELTAL
ncbi:phage head spike fiber domain-containing protein [Vreelandella venusta]|uniref:phage head spike fiber domain-containing protein n=1 Tax=Vreelandella venusta TaxID=44935 RepID=UPI004044FA05